jgi:hypothetical protein
MAPITIHAEKKPILVSSRNCVMIDWFKVSNTIWIAVTIRKGVYPRLLKSRIDR